MEDRETPVSAVSRASMLRMARNWQSLGQVNQAIDVYLRILRQHPATQEGTDARGRLLDLAASFEREGRFRLAMDLYDRVERACR